MAVARSFFLAVAASCLVAIPLLAQERGGHPSGGGGGGMAGAPHGMPGGAQGMSGAPHGTPGGFVQSHGRSIYTGGPRGPVGWSEFHHDTAPAKVSPHRYGDTNLPRPSAWHGNFHDFDLDRWHGGDWHHGWHNGRWGWWWAVGPDWFYFDQPVYPYPDLYTPYGEAFGWWYWCDASQEYYPYVTYCPVEWESVMPMD